MKKALKWGAVLLAALASVVCLWCRISNQFMTSDAACMLLEAKDVLSGNLLLSDWNLTGITFITTDLPWFILSVAMFGVSLKAYHAAVFMMCIFLIICAMPLIFHNVKNKWAVLPAFAALGLFRSGQGLMDGFVHTGCFALCFLAIYFFVRCFEGGGLRYLIMLAVTTALAVCGDHTAVLLIVVPVAVICCFKPRKGNFKTFISCALGACFGIALELVFILAGGADYNSTPRCFVEGVSEIAHNFGLIIQCTMNITGTNFFGSSIISLYTVVCGIRMLLVLAALVLLAKAVVCFFADKDYDIVTCALGLAFLAMLAVLLVTDYTVDYGTARYISFMPLMLAAALGRNSEQIGLDIKCRYIVYSLCAMAFVLNFIPFGLPTSPYTGRSDMAEFLVENNLEYGYSTFWNASSMTAYSGEKVQVRAIIYKDSRLQPYRWFSKNSWYETDKAQFVVIEENDDVFGLTYENALMQFGTPAKELKFNTNTILIYDKIELENVK